MDERTAMGFLAGMGVGAGLMFILDPQAGRRRRSLLRDRASGAMHEVREGWDVLQQDVSNRARGLAAEARARFSGEPVDDRVLVERVRSHLGRVVSHPHAIHTEAHDGRVTVSGPVLADEANRLLACVRSVPGVKDVEDRLERHEEPGNVSALQGGRTRRGPRWELLQDNWSPTTRLLVGLAGGGMVAYGLTQRFPVACVVGTVGLAVMASALSNRGVRDLVPERMSDWLPEAMRSQRTEDLAEAVVSVASGV
jgi:hypothetical protein